MKGRAEVRIRTKEKLPKRFFKGFRKKGVWGGGLCYYSSPVSLFVSDYQTFGQLCQWADLLEASVLRGTPFCCSVTYHHLPFLKNSDEEASRGKKISEGSFPKEK